MGGDKKVHTFSKGISLKGTIRASLEAKFAYNNVAIQHCAIVDRNNQYHITMCKQQTTFQKM